MEEVIFEMESILTSIKKLLGITEEYTAFDQDLIMHINSVFAILMQLGVGPKDGFMITDKSETWNQFTTKNAESLVKSYIHLKVRMMFDPPTSGIVSESMNNTIKEYEWRLSISNDNPPVMVKEVR